MVTAIVLLTVAKHLINEIAEAIADINEISEVYTVTGHYDLAVIIRAPDNDTLADVITKQLLKMDGIIQSESLFAFRVYTRHDLESMFNIGNE